jgi:hypothetical protein
MDSERWSALPLDEWRDTYATLHMWTQVVGKVRLALAPRLNHWWNVALYVTPRGLTTSTMPCDTRSLAIDFDFIDHELRLVCSDGAVERVALHPMSVADFHRTVMATLAKLGVRVRIWPVPVEVPEPIPFERDTVHSSYDQQAVERFHRVLVQVERVFSRFRAGFSGKCSPVHFFWGSFDLAVTRFSGRPAPPRPDADPITRLSYNAELSSLGFWPGGGAVDFPAFYSYMFPEPAGYRSQPVEPAGARFDESLGEYLLAYDGVRTLGAPDEAILAFAQSTFEAGARLQHWPLQ